MIYLYSKLDDVKREVVFSTTCLRSRRGRTQLRQCVVLLSVKNNVTKKGKKSHLYTKVGGTISLIFKRVSMGLTDSRKTAKNLVDSGKN